LAHISAREYTPHHVRKIKIPRRESGYRNLDLCHVIATTAVGGSGAAATHYH
jgi:hypothetical protein